MTGIDLTWMYCPGTRLDLLEKAYASSADVVIYDLEDAVLPALKDEARENVRTFLTDVAERSTAGGPKIQVRVNGFDTPWMAADLHMVTAIRGFGGVRVPKVETIEQVAQVREIVGDMPIHALVETAKGLSNLEEICASDLVAAVSLGDVDLRTELRLSGEQALDQFRIRLVVALAAHGKPAPVGSVYVDLADAEGLLKHTHHLRSLGFVGRSALHPKQLTVIREGFQPSAKEIKDARELLAAAEAASTDAGLGAFMLPNGRFVDVPIIRQAQDVLTMADSTAAAS